jgi:gliding motility-associated-like protein
MTHPSSGLTGRIRGHRYGLAAIVLLLCLTFASGALRAQVTAGFTPNRTQVCPGTYVTFSNTTSHPAGASMAWAWTFPAGLPNADTSRNPTVYFATPGVKTITLTATNTGTGETDAHVATITVWMEPTANFSYSVPDPCQPLQIQFTDGSAAGSAAITDYIWNFGDGGFASAANPGHAFPATGAPFEVVLVTEDANGCSDDHTVYITPDPPLAASVTFDSTLACGAGPSNVGMVAAASGGTPPYTYAWDFGDGTNGSGPITNHVYNGCGTYDVRLTVTDDAGCVRVRNFPAAVELFCPTVDFTLSADTVCAGETLLVSDASTAGAVSQQWQFDPGDPGAVSGGSNTGYVYSAPGSYTVTHCVVYANGCTECTTRDVVVRNKPLAGSIQITDSLACALPFSTTLSAVGATGTAPIQYEWLIAGVTYTGAVINPTITTPGLFDVQLIVSDATGCTDTILRRNLIRVRAADASFTMDPPLGCDPLQATIYNTSFSPVVAIDSFTWDFGDGSGRTSTAADTFTHVFSGVGTYTVTLVAHTALGCPDTATTTVLVGQVNADFELLSDTVCAVANVLNDTEYADYTVLYWGNGDSTVLPDPLGDYSYFYTGIDTPTHYTISMVASFNGCTETVLRDILVLPPVAYPREVTRDCSDPFTVTLWVDPAYLVGSFCWDAGNGDTLCDVNPATFTFPAEGEYRVYIRDPDNPLFDTTCVMDYFDIPIIDAVADWSADDTEGCESLTVNFTNADPTAWFDSLTYVWTIGPGLYTGTSDLEYVPGDSFRYPFTVPDIYPVSMTPLDSSLCNASFADTIVISDLTAYFLIDSVTGCLPALVHFRDSSYNYANDPRLAITTWEWTFDNPLCPDYNGQNPPPCAYDPGTYTAYLRVRDVAGCVKTYGREFTIGPDSVFAAFGHTAPVCGNDTTYFNNVSTSPNGVAAVFWEFGDGTTSTEFSPGHVYAASGSYAVRLTVTDSNGCTAQRTRGVTVDLGDLVPDFDVQYLSAAVCPPIPVRLINTSLGSWTATEWIVETSTGTAYYSGDTAAHVYMQSGTWDIRMVVTDSRGCVDTLLGADEVYITGPTGDMSLFPTEGCAPHTVSFDLENIVADQIFIDFGNGDTLEVFGDFDFTYTEPGSYCPRLILLDSLGCETTYNCPAPVTVYDSPTAGLSVGDPSICDGGTLWVRDTSFAGAISPLDSVLLDLGDGTSYAFAGGFDSVAHVYGANGLYTVTLVAINAGGCTDTARFEVGVGPLPMGAFGLDASQGCAPVTITALLTGVVADSAFIDWGDGTVTYTDSSVAHTYPVPGVYVPRLIMRNATGCETIIANGSAIRVGHAPLAALAVPDTAVCVDDALLFINRTVDTVPNPAINPVDLLELFVNGTSVASGPPMDSVWYTASVSGTLPVWLVASSDLGCSDTAFAAVTVQAIPAGAYGIADGTGCAPVTATVSFAGLAADSAWIHWGDGTRELVSGAPVSHAYPVPGVYGPRLELVNAGGCSRDIDNGDPVTVAYAPEARLAVPDTAQCQRGEFRFINQSVDTVGNPSINAIDQLRLYFDDVLLASGPPLDTVTYVHNNAGDFPVWLVASNDQGCADTARQMLRVHTVPLAIADGDAEVCVGLEAQLDGSGSLMGTDYRWEPASAVADPDAAVTTADLAASTTFVLTVDNGFCSSRDSVRVNVIERLDLEPGPDADFCTASPVPLSASLNTDLDGVSWVWSPATALSDPYSLTPVALPNGDAAYTITATCGDLEEAATIFVTQLPPPAVEASADTALLILGSSVGLTAEGAGGTGALDYRWEQTPDLSCTDCPDPRATPMESGWYTVWVEDEAGCTDLDSVYLRVYTDCLGEDFEVGRAFTPNGDGLNDAFAFRGETIAEIEYVRVWNRWGETVFETDRIDDFWDGTHRGNPLNPAVFAWAIRGWCLNGEPFLRTGDVTLIK